MPRCGNVQRGILRSGDFCRVEVLAVLQHFQMDVRFLGAFTADGAHGAQLLPGGHGVAGFHGGAVTTLLHRPSVPVSVTLPEQGALTALPSAQA